MSTTITEAPQVQHTVKAVQLQDPHKYDYNNLAPYSHPPETKEALPWSELVTLDLEDLPRPGGKERLAKQLEHAVHHVGFFYVKNYGISEEEVQQQFTLAKAFFELPVEEKEKHECNYAEADYNGWRRNGRRLQAKAFDNVEVFNFPKYVSLVSLCGVTRCQWLSRSCLGRLLSDRINRFTPDFEGKYTYPDVLQSHISEIETFQRALHSNVVLPLLRLFAIILQLPDEEYLVKQHTYDKKSEDHSRVSHTLFSSQRDIY